MESQLPEAIRQRIESCGVVAVLIIERVEDAVPVAQALLDGGVTAMELTLRTPVAIDALRVIRQEVPDMLAGIGTILTPQQVQEVVAAGCFLWSFSGYKSESHSRGPTSRASICPRRRNSERRGGCVGARLPRIEIFPCGTEWRTALFEEHGCPLFSSWGKIHSTRWR